MSRRVIPKAGERFGRWVVIGNPISIKSRIHVECVCDCGKKATVASSQLRFGISQSCGCLQKDRVTKHGAASRKGRSSEYDTWAQMRHRCRNPNDPAYLDYGGRGIQVCRAWEDFSQFFSDMGPRPSGHSLDRINNDGNYEPSNCRWAPQSTQIRNRRNTRNITLNGMTMCLNDWAKKLGVSVSRLQYRYERGMTAEEILSHESRRTKRRQTQFQSAHRR